jgi:ATP-dependent DNA ligase
MKERPKREGIMLAYPLDEGRLSRLGKHFLMQPKLRGERVIVEWFAGEAVLISSYGNEFKFMDHITAALKPMYDKFGPIPFDGEIYKHGWSQEQINSAMNRKVNRSSESVNLEYHIFDLRTNDKCYQRLEMLGNLTAHKYLGAPGSILIPVPAVMGNASNWLEITSDWVSQGYEGGILRKIDAPWEARRTVNMLKFKPTEEDEYTILDINEAIDKHGQLKGMVGSFTVKADNTDESFKVGAGKMVHTRRVELWRLRHTLVGEKLLVKHELLRTKGGVPVCAVAVDLLRES